MNVFFIMNDLVVGLIPDGHRRFSKVNNVDLEKSYSLGVRNIFDVGSFLFNSGKIKELVVYFLSSENLKRGKKELKLLWKLLRKYLDSVFSNKDSDLFSREETSFWKEKVKVCFVGRRTSVSKDVVDFMSDIEEKTCNNSDFVVTVAVGYGSKQELTDCFNRIRVGLDSGSLSHVDEGVISDNLDFKKDIDFVIRSGFNKRLSNFFCWQTSYADLFFLDKFWPDVSVDDFKKILSEIFLIQKTKGL